MFGFIVLSCSLSVTAVKVECNYTVKETFSLAMYTKIIIN